MSRVWVDQSAPRTLVELNLDGGSTWGNYASVDVAMVGAPYHGRLVQEPTVSRRIVDVFWGPVEVQEVSIVLANGDGALTQSYLNDLRGRTLVVKRYDQNYGTVITEWIGQVEQASLTGDATLELAGTNLNLAVFDQDYPPGWAILSTGAGTHPTALDLGSTYPIVFGNVPRVWLPNVRDDTANNLYEYVLAGGTSGPAVSISQLWRDGPNDTLQLIQFSEYTITTETDFTRIRFPLRQVNFQGGRHHIYADVFGFQTERNFVRAVQQLLGGYWGLGQPIDTASFDTAAALLPPNLFCDGAFTEPRRAKDLLRELLMPRGMRLGVNNLGQWQITVDTQAPAPTLAIRDGMGPGERNLLNVRRRTRTGLSDRPKSFILKYRRDLIDDEYLFTQARTIGPTSGREVTEENPFVRNHETADRITDYMAKRLNYGQETIEDVEITPAARTLKEGDLVTIAYTPIGTYDPGATYEVTRVDKDLTTIRTTLGGWNAAIYTYTPGTIPPDDTPGTFDDLSRTTPTQATAVSVFGAGIENTATGSEAWTTLRFTVPTANCVGVKLDWKKSGDAIWAGGVMINQTGGPIDYRIRGLVNGLVYDYRVSTISPWGLASAGVIIATVPAGTIPAPAAVGQFTVGASGTNIGTDGRTTAVVVFQLYIDPGAVNYARTRIDMKRSGDSAWQEGVGWTSATGSSVVEVIGLTPGVSYDFQAVALNQFDQASSAVQILGWPAPGDTTVPAVPTGVGATGGPTHVLIYCNANTEDDIAGYDFDIRTAAGGGGSLLLYGSMEHNPVSRPTTTVAYTGLGYGTRYVRMRAVDYTGNGSAYSAGTAFTIVQVNTPDLDTGSVSTSFSASAGATGSYPVDGLWKSLNQKPITITYATSQLFAFGWANINKTSAGDVIISLRVVDNTALISGQPVINILWGNGNWPLSPLFVGVIDPSMQTGFGWPTGTHQVDLQVKGEGTAGQFYQVNASVLEAWEQRR
jgi:hypothetical protein